MGVRQSLKRWSSPLRGHSGLKEQQIKPSPEHKDEISGTETVYQYTDLDVLRQEIRIFQIEGISSEAQPKGVQPIATSAPCIIRGSLKRVPLFELPAFVALSYTWGETGEKAQLIVDDRELPITKSLHVALTHLHQAKISFVWADAICINQQNLVEKASQIRRLATIFRAAERVIAWVGVHDEHTRSIFEFIQRYREARGLKISKETAVHLRSAFVALSERSYWTRLWILQEFACANQLYIMCGNDVEDAGLLRELLSYFWRHGKYTTMSELTHFQYMWSVREQYRSGATMGLLEMLISTTLLEKRIENREVHRVFQSTVILDQVYALLGLVSDGDLFILEPDYNITQINDLFTRMTKFFIWTSKQLDICFLERGEKPVDFGSSQKIDSASYAPENLPAWCPDYLNLVGSAQNVEIMNAFESKQATPVKLLRLSHRYSRSSYCWNATAHSRLTAGSYILDDDGSMFARGKLVGTVLDASEQRDYFQSSVRPGNEIGVTSTFWLTTLLYTYASSPARPFAQIIEALIFILSGAECYAPGCCESERAWLKDRLLAPDDASDDLAPFITKQLLQGMSNTLITPSTSMSLKEVDEASWPIVESVKCNYKLFRRKVAAYKANDRDLRVSDIAKESGAYGWVPQSTCANDEIWLLEGCSMPIVLRKVVPKSNSSGLATFTKIGPAVINGAMSGAMWSLDHLRGIVIVKP